MSGQHILDIKPNAKQIDFFNHREKFLLYGGAKGGGKSWALRTKQILRRLRYPGSKGLLLRRTFPELSRTHIIKIKEEMPKGSWTYNNGSHIFTFPNGSTLECGSCQYEADVLNYQGAEYDDIGVDEATNFTEYQFNILKSCLRTVRKDLVTQMYLGANPGGVGHGWVKREFITQQLPDHHFVPAKVWDNPVLMEADPEYVKTLEKLPPELKRMYLEGDWDIFAGQVFWEWRRDKHVIDSFDYPIELCGKLVSFDWGYNAPGCASWLAFTPEGRAYQYRELYQTTHSPLEWAKQMKVFFAVEKVQEVVLPHDCFSHLSGNQMIADVFRNEWADLGEMAPRIVRGNTGTVGAVKNRLAIMHQYLTDAPDGKPWFQVHAKCQNFIRTLPELVYSETDVEAVNSAGEDHAYDATSIGLLRKVELTLGSGAVKDSGPQKAQAIWRPDDEGNIQGSDFWGAMKNAMLKGGRTWEHK